MKKKLLSIAALMLAVMGVPNAMAQEEVDVTEQYIQNADFKNGISSWNATADGGQAWKAYNQDPNVVEAYAGWDALLMKNYELSQEITLPAGSYRLEAYAFYRKGPGWNIVSSASLAYLFVGLNQVLIKALDSEAGANTFNTDVKWANTDGEASQIFAKGYYLNKVNFTLSAEEKVKIGVQGTHDASYSWCIAGPFKLIKIVTAADKYQITKDALLAYKPSLNTAWKGKIDAKVAEVDATLTGTPADADYNAASETLLTFQTEVVAFSQAYNAALNEKAKYVLFHDNSTDVAEKATYKSAIDAAGALLDAAETSDALDAALDDYSAARLAYAPFAVPQEGKTLDFTFYIKDANVTDVAYWTGGKLQTNGQVYTGAPDNLHFDVWNAMMDVYQDITSLPSGVYKLTCATRADASISSAYAYAKVGATEYKTNVNAIGSTGGELGGGWNWTYVENIEVSSGTTLRIGFYMDGSGAKWAGVDVFKLEKVGALSAEEEITQLQTVLTDKITEAQALNTGVNVGNGAFQIPETAKTALTNAVAAAEGKQSSNDVEELSAAISALEAAITSYESAELNVPVEGQCFNVVMRQDGYIHDGKAVTFIANGRTDAGLYNIQYLTAPNANLAQALIFTKVAGESNVYTVSMMDIDGAQRYMCTGTVYGGNSSQIRTTLEADKAAKVKVAATDVEGVYTLLNVEANQFIGCQDYKADAAAGVFTTDQNHNLKIQEAEKATVELAANAGWATLALPFAAEIPAGLKVYSAVDVNNSVIELTDEGSLKANTPYIVNVTAEQKVSFSGWGLASSVTCNSGMLTGVFANTAAPVGSYVLQNQPDVDGVAFYNVVADAQPTVTANHAYLTLPADAGANIRALLLPGSDATGIETVEAADATVDVYSISGVLVRSGVKKSEALNGLAKGIYIVGGVKRTVK